MEHAAPAEVETVPTPSDAQSWELIPHFIVRSTGFSLEWIERLRLTRSVQAIQSVLQLEGELAARRELFLSRFMGWVDQEQKRQTHGAPVFGVLYGVRRAVLRGRPIPDALMQAFPNYPDVEPSWPALWNRAVAELEERRAVADATWTEELAERRVTLRAMTEDARLQEALFLSNPNMLDTALPFYGKYWSRDQRPAKIKHIERRLVTYLQRFCAKNDVQSFFGPLNYGRLDTQDRLGLTWTRTGRPLRRAAFFAYWGAIALAERIAADPGVRPYLRPIANPGYRLENATTLTILATGQQTALAPTIGRFLQACDGRATAMELIERFKLELEPALKLLDMLASRHFISLAPPLAAASPCPLDALRTQVARLPLDCNGRARWLAVLDRFETLRQDYTAEGAQAKARILEQTDALFQQITGEPPRRAAGEMYADRTLLYEECQGDLADFRLEGRLAEDLQRRLSGILDLAATYSCLLQQAYQQAAQDLFRQLSPEGKPIAFARFAHACPARIDLSNSPASAFLDRLDRIVADRRSALPPGSPVCLETETLGLVEPERLRGQMLLGSPDVMLAAPDPSAVAQGDYRWVIGEVHWGLQLCSNLLCFHSDSELVPGIRARLRELPGYGEMANLVLRKRYGKMFYQEVFETSVEFLGRSVLPRTQVIPWSDLIVELDRGELRLSSGSRGRRIRLYLGDPDTPLAWIFGAPALVLPRVAGGPHTPRVELDGVVYQRETWRVPAGEWPAAPATATGLERMLQAWRFKQTIGLPDRVFLRVSSERKPVYIDWNNFFLIELLEHLADSGHELVFTEMLPGPEACWLHSPEGRHTCELRFSAFRRSAPAGCSEERR